MAPLLSAIFIGLTIWMELFDSAIGNPVTLRNGGYEGVVVGISEDVPSENCRIVLGNLMIALTGASKFLFSSLEGRAYFREISINLPDHWSDSCVNDAVFSSSGEEPDFVMGRSHPVYGDQIWTQQSRGCGEQGDFIYLSEKLLTETNDLANHLVREWGKYRYGIFDEIGYENDPVYPQCYRGVNDKPQVTGCSDKPIENVCSTGELVGRYNASRMVRPDAEKSILFSAGGRVTKFCDEKTHNAFAPTKQNVICHRKSAMEVILNHPDFSNKHLEVFDGTFTNTTPMFRYTRRRLTRYVLVVENTKDMLARESWSFLRAAIRKWTVHDLPVNTEVGFVLANETSAVKVHDLHLLNGANARDWVASDVPFTPGDSRMPACVSCGVKEAIEMLEEAKRASGSASSVILIISPGIDKLNEVEDMVGRAKRSQIRIATINYPGVLRSNPLDLLSSATGGLSFTVNERKHNLINSLLTTYFDLTNALYAITTRYFEGNPDSLPIEIHRRELVDDGRSTITGSFFLEESLGEPAEFVIYTHSIDNPLLGAIQLVSPSQKVYTGRTDSFLQFKLMKVVANINETGPWTYTIERFRNPQPHFVQVMASPKSPTAPVVRTKFWTNLNQDHSPRGTQRRRRDLQGDMDEVENQGEWTSQTSFPNSVRHAEGRSYESEPIGQDPETVLSGKTGKMFSDFPPDEDDSKISDDFGEFKRSPAYRLTHEPKRNQISLNRPAVTKPVVFYVEVKSGMWPVRGARVEVTVTKRATNDTNRYKERFELLDTGSGDPDLMRGDGIYSKYWSPVSGGKGSYTIEITVSDNGNTAYSWNEGFFIPQNDDSCCGSQMTSPSVRPLSPFQRQLPPLTLTFTQEDIDNIQAASVGRVADLIVEHMPSELKARLIWTAPDMGGLDVARYALHYTPSLETLLSDPESTPVWRQETPFPLAAGSETSFTLDFSRERNLLDHPLFFALLAYGSPHESAIPGPLSNYVRVFLSSPPPPPPPPPSPTDYSVTRWLNKNHAASNEDVVPRIAQADFRLELILPIVGGILFLIICLAVYCYFCVVRRRHSGISKGKQTVTSSPEKNKQTSINIISTPTALAMDNKTHSTSSTTSSDTSHSTLQQDTGANVQYDPAEPPMTTYREQTGEQIEKYGYVRDPNQQYEDQFAENERRRYSMLQTPEEAYIISQARNIGQQRPPSNMSMPGYGQQPPGYVVSQIGNGTTGRIRTLSPFQSWTASQLLHEHERRNSPYGEKTDSLDRMDDINRHNGPQFQLPPPVPPLPAGVYNGEPTYGHGPYVESAVRSTVTGINHQSPNYAGYIRGTINPSLQGSLSSVNGCDVRKKRNVTMV